MDAETSRHVSKAEIRVALVKRGNQQLAVINCPLHQKRAYLAESASPNNIVISGCCDQFITNTALGLGFRVDGQVRGGAPTRLLSAGLQVL